MAVRRVCELFESVTWKPEMTSVCCFVRCFLVVFLGLGRNF